MRSIHYQLYSDDTEKPWILLIHGLFGSADNLSGLRKLFTGSHQVLSIDLPDHGKSAFTTGFSFTSYAEKVVALLAHLDIHKVDVLGHSLGGKVAMSMALSFPNLVSSLVVLDIAPVHYAPRHQLVFDGLNSINLDTLSSRKEADLLLATHISESSTRQFLLKSLYKDNERWKWRFNLDLLQREYHLLSEGIKASSTFDKPVLFIKGGKSDYLLLEHRSAIIALFPNSQSKVIPNAGHWLHAQNPTLCYKFAYSFLKVSNNLL
ncbi:alpha/beta fold hydrolase [Paraglaciecola aquimarina]|uniref:Alpha/beta fold hydrolase n=1 Tax=Paraglaciecola aquimarina TaxID=1235557 RepID=A0ABU3SYU6_9ALTE|nr:alpha/beta fold hydrolase [Paraglaciecola aquimarina]MDU0355161.1 alpha/beta fold hydrolase [Paraglaciecola aquimarina]